MKRFAFILIMVLLATIISCGSSDTNTEGTVVSIKTEFGEIKVRLYDETPEHKKNFIKLVDEGFYNDLLFHRVMNNFMIQGGDPDSKGAAAGIRLGGGSPGYTVPAEFIPKYFHKKGALAAARKGGPSNPEKRSSGSQFYIVQGDVFSAGKLDTMEMSLNSKAKNEMMKEKFEASSEKLDAFKTNNNRDGFNIYIAEIRAEVDSIYESGEKFVFTPEQREAYTTIGGYPSLDGEYTVFGEVIEGLDILDKIAVVETDKQNRPVVDVKMQVEIVK